MARNKLVEGEWRVGVSDSATDDGTFHRPETTFRDRIRADSDARYQPESGRYHLYISRACPWAHGAAMTRSLLGLTDAISVDVVDPYRQDRGWEFSPEKEGCTADSILGADYLHEVYTAADPDYTGRVSVPVLWDRHHETIVNNESIEIMRMLADTFRTIGNGVDLYPDADREAIDGLVDRIYGPINDGVYRAGFAGTQAAHERAVEELFEALDQVASVLADRRYLLGNSLTLADLRLFATLVRFDPVYHTHFKCTVRRVVDYPTLWNYTKDLYQTPGITETVDIEQIKEHYYRSHTSINPTQFVPLGPDFDLAESHNRGHLPGGPPALVVD